MTHLVQSVSLKPTTFPVAAWSMGCVNFRFTYAIGGAPGS